jgi:hypothetical protein
LIQIDCSLLDERACKPIEIQSIQVAWCAVAATREQTRSQHARVILRAFPSVPLDLRQQNT